MPFRAFRRSASLALAATVALSAPVMAITDAERTELREEMRRYLMENPEVLLEAMQALEAKRSEEEAKARSSVLASMGDVLRETPRGAALGNQDGDVTLVEFFDYNCGYCKSALPQLQSLIAADPKLRVVLREIPVLGEPSLRASSVSLAFRHLSPERYGEFHSKLLGHRGVADEDSALAVAEELGQSEAAIRAAMALPEVKAALDESTRLSMMLRIDGTPTYVVANEVVVGAVEAETLQAKIENVRRCASTVC